LPLKYKLPWRSGSAKEKARVLNSDQISEVYDTPKALLRKMFSTRLPETVLTRRKVGFPVPLDAWLTEHRHDFLDQLLFSNDSRCKSLFARDALQKWMSGRDLGHSSRRGLTVWMLANLEIWLREYNVSV